MKEELKAWRKVGGGSLTLKNGKTYRSSDGVFHAHESDISKTFMRSVVEVISKRVAQPEPDVEETEITKIPVKKDLVKSKSISKKKNMKRTKK